MDNDELDISTQIQARLRAFAQEFGLRSDASRAELLDALTQRVFVGPTIRDAFDDADDLERVASGRTRSRPPETERRSILRPRGASVFNGGNVDLPVESGAFGLTDDRHAYRSCCLGGEGVTPSYASTDPGDPPLEDVKDATERTPRGLPSASGRMAIMSTPRAATAAATAGAQTVGLRPLEVPRTRPDTGAPGAGS